MPTQPSFDPPLPTKVGNLQYTPIAIQWVSPFLDQDGSDLHTRTPSHPNRQSPQYWVQIEPPGSTQKGLHQTLGETLSLKIPQDGLLRLLLAPSDRYLPVGRYRVRYFAKGSSRPIQTQEWVVPHILPISTTTFLYEEESIILPYNVWQVQSVSVGDAWVSNYNTLTWQGNPTELLNQSIVVRYRPAVTLETLLNPTGNRDVFSPAWR